MEVSQLIFTGVIVREKDRYSALCIDLDVASEGEEINEAKKIFLKQLLSILNQHWKATSLSSGLFR